jgi:hypothetical protein
MNKQQYLTKLRQYRAHRRSKDWVRSWFFSSDVTCPNFQFVRLNPEE